MARLSLQIQFRAGPACFFLAVVTVTALSAGIRQRGEDLSAAVPPGLGLVSDLIKRS